jgi:hypothetical protein
MPMQDPLDFRRPAVGPALRRRRLAAGHSHLALAQADGRWSTGDVTALEETRAISSSEMSRYLSALNKLERTALPKE